MTEPPPTEPPPTEPSSTSSQSAEGEEESDEQPSAGSELDPVVAELLENSRIVIRAGGEVVIEHLSERLADVALSLDPSNELQCRLGREDSER